MKPNASMTGKTCLVTGANSGIGKEISRELAFRGARVLMVARSAERGEQARDEVAASTGNDDVELLLCDLSSQREVRRLAHEVLASEENLHVLVKPSREGRDSAAAERLWALSERMTGPEARVSAG